MLAAAAASDAPTHCSRLHLAGTSYSTALVSGAAALLFSAKTSASNTEVKAALLAGVDQVAGLADKVASGGRLNAARALASLLGEDAPFMPSVTCECRHHPWLPGPALRLLGCASWPPLSIACTIPSRLAPRPSPRTPHADTKVVQANTAFIFEGYYDTGSAFYQLVNTTSAAECEAECWGPSGTFASWCQNFYWSATPTVIGDTSVEGGYVIGTCLVLDGSVWYNTAETRAGATSGHLTANAAPPSPPPSPPSPPRQPPPPPVQGTWGNPVPISSLPYTSPLTAVSLPWRAQRSAGE